ncbi:MAG: glycosyltransferase family 2 protein [Lachnospiraceae bacterium]|nr:glycosyltransferase family 2 protein [Lachnospiraceae bacterium]
MKKVTIITPCYNAANCLDIYIEKLALQSVGMDALEIIMVDDCSKDNTLEKLREIEQKYPESVMLIPLEKNVRQGAARNIAIQYATADHILFLDADDTLHPKAVEKLLKKAREDDADVVQFLSTDTHTVGEINEEIKSGKKDLCITIKNDETRRMFVMSDAVVYGCWNKLYRTAVIKDNSLKFAEGVLLEEPLLTFPLYFYIRKFSMLNEYLYNYYQNPKGTCRSLFYDEEHIYDNVKVQYELLCDLKRRGLLEKYHDEIEARIADCYYYQSVSNLFAINRPIDIDVLNSMAATMRTYFPDIRHNPYLNTYPVMRDNLDMLFTELTKDNLEKYSERWRKICSSTN